MYGKKSKEKSNEKSCCHLKPILVNIENTFIFILSFYWWVASDNIKNLINAYAHLSNMPAMKTLSHPHTQSIRPQNKCQFQLICSYRFRRRSYILYSTPSEVVWWYLVVLFITWQQLNVCCTACITFLFLSLIPSLLFIYWLSDIQQSGSAYWKMYVFFIWCVLFFCCFVVQQKLLFKWQPKKDETRSHMWLTNTVNRFQSQKKNNRRAKCASTIDTLNDSNDENGS